jgi:hypothetical protein
MTIHQNYHQQQNSCGHFQHMRSVNGYSDSMTLEINHNMQMLHESRVCAFTNNTNVVRENIRNLAAGMHTAASVYTIVTDFIHRTYRNNPKECMDTRSWLPCNKGMEWILEISWKGTIAHGFVSI